MINEVVNEAIDVAAEIIGKPRDELLVFLDGEKLDGVVCVDAPPLFLGVGGIMEDMFKRACRIHTSFFVARYLMSNAEGRLDGAEKAERHRELCEFYIRVVTGMGEYEYDIELFYKLHSATQDALTDRMDEVIGFPLKGRPDYDVLRVKFFDVWHKTAMEVLTRDTVKEGSDLIELLSDKDEYELMHMLATQVGVASPESQEERNTSSRYQRAVLRAAIKQLRRR